ncbi:MAG: hypothetical protein LBV08_09600 [Clostridiales bacterium]|jgi:hypothetical protein|nr:hypothetical protein [Clostridiales bacterium]
MGMPVITTGTGSRSQAITDLIESVALQEVALSHILNAEGEKMQAIISSNATQEELFAMNDSVSKLVSSATRLEMILQAKLELFAEEGIELPMPPKTTAADEFEKIKIATLTADFELDAPGAQAGAIALALGAARAVVSPDYIVAFIFGNYTPGVLSGKFKVTKAGDPTDTAGDDADRAIIITTTYIRTSPVELEKITVSSIEIDIALDAPGASDMAADMAVAGARAQIALGYTINFILISYVAGALTGKFTVKNDADPADTAEDITGRDISVTTTWRPAVEELAKINVPAVMVDVPLEGQGVQELAAAQAVDVAQAQVTMGYVANFTAENYSGGVLTGKFTAIDIFGPDNKATDKSSREISVGYEPTTAGAQLAGINVREVPVTMPVDFPDTDMEAADVAALKAQTQISASYTAAFDLEGYNPSSGIFTGRFKVTSAADPTDTAGDTNARSVAALYTPAPAAEAELAKIEASSINVSEPLSESSIAAAAQVIAQAQIAPGYSVFFQISHYDAPGTLWGRFVVMNDAVPTDRAANTADYEVRAAYVPA